MLINTAFGVAAVRRVAPRGRTLRSDPAARFTIILPGGAHDPHRNADIDRHRCCDRGGRGCSSAAPALATSCGRVEQPVDHNVITAILVIGVVGMILDQMLARAARMVTFPE